MRYGCTSSGLYNDTVSLDAPVKNGDDLALVDTIADENTIQPEEAAESEYLRVYIWQMCERNLSEQEYRFIVDKYKNKKTYKLLATENNITASYAHSVTEKAIRKLKRNKDIREIGQEWGYLYFRNVSTTEFNRTWTSSVEWAVIKGMDSEERLKVYKKLQGVIDL